jgi:hypothetical protein
LDLLSSSAAAATLGAQACWAVAEVETQLSTLTDREVYLKSDGVLAAITPALQGMGFTVEKSKSSADRIHRPVLFGEHGRAAMNALPRKDMPKKT